MPLVCDVGHESQLKPTTSRGVGHNRQLERAAGLMLVCPPKSQTWNLMFLYWSVSTLNPIVGIVDCGSSPGDFKWSGNGEGASYVYTKKEGTPVGYM